MFRKIAPTTLSRKPITIFIDGIALDVEEGEPIAAILLRVAPFTNRATPVTGVSRAPFCLMGACFDCLVEIDGETSTRSCLVPAQAGMQVRRQPSRPDPAPAFI